ncbi:sulfur-oxidizing protein SoxY [Geopseudomonas guangdongensis]|uniref:Sulfur-oxidizing protein SoxY n=2 Tax=Geopseudomonas guangdongensis TaxID=1245526 RepID=A0A1H2HK12_9GAMM|nr:sulfur-oxidizing protein SoxY [Pseudomonas guangdongensis]
MTIRSMGLALGWLLLSGPLWAGESDPLQSPMWSFHQTRFLGAAPYEFDERVRLSAPPFAEDARQVPISIDATALGSEVVRILAWAELNPIPQIFSFFPTGPVAPRIALSIRVEQATPIRAAVLTRDGVWHVGSTRVDAAGGGCTAPSAVRAQGGWEDHLGEVFGARFPMGEGSRLRLRVSHPMDNGLSGGIPEFFIERAELRSEAGEVLASLELHPSVSENPTLTLQLGDREAGQRLWLRDNNGNEFEAAF